MKKEDNAPAGLTAKQLKALNKRIAENTEVVKKRFGAKLFNKAAKAVEKVMNDKNSPMNKTEQSIPAKPESKSAEDYLTKAVTGSFDAEWDNGDVSKKEALEAMEFYATQQLSLHTQQLAEENERLRKENEWTSVEDRLPEASSYYLTWQNGFSRPVELYWGLDDPCFRTIDRHKINVTHWRPLPSPPTISKEGE